MAATGKTLTGTFQARKVKSFTNYGNGTPQGAPANFFGGLLVLHVDITPDTDPKDRIPAVLTIDCLLGAPPAGAEKGINLNVPGLIDFDTIRSTATSPRHVSDAICHGGAGRCESGGAASMSTPAVVSLSSAVIRSRPSRASFWSINRSIAASCRWRSDVERQLHSGRGTGQRFYSAVFGMRYLDPISWHFGDPSTPLQGYVQHRRQPRRDGSQCTRLPGATRPPRPHRHGALDDLHRCTRHPRSRPTAAQLGGTVMLAPYDTAFGPVSAITDNQGAHLTLAPRPPKG